MKINELYIKDYKLLKDFRITFEKLMPILIGENGNGKSSVLESIAYIFSHLHKYCVDGEKDVSNIGDYRICYNIEDCEGIERDVKFESSSAEKDDDAANLKITIDGLEMSLSSIKRKYTDFGGVKNFLPDNIILYYAGVTDRMSKLNDYFFSKVSNRLMGRATQISLKDLTIERPIVYCDKKHLPVILLSLLLANSDIQKKLNIRTYDTSIQLSLKRPSWAAKTSQASDLWGHKGGTVFNALSKLANKYVLIPENVNEERLFLITSFDFIHDFMVDEDIDGNPLAMYAFIDFLFYNDILDSVDLSWKNSKGEEITLDNLSEGEKQVILTSGMIELWNVQRTLFLYDEPDTFLHPSWQVSLIPEISKHINKQQVIMTTHSPLLLSTLRDSEVYLMSQGKCARFDEHLYGMNANEVLSQAMRTGFRAPEVQILIDKINMCINEKRLDDAQVSLSELEEEVTLNNNEVIRLKGIINRMRILGK